MLIFLRVTISFKSPLRNSVSDVFQIHLQSQKWLVVWTLCWHWRKTCHSVYPTVLFIFTLVKKKAFWIIYDIQSCLINQKLNEHSRNLIESDPLNVNKPLVRREIDVPNCKSSLEEESLKAFSPEPAKLLFITATFLAGLLLEDLPDTHLFSKFAKSIFPLEALTPWLHSKSNTMPKAYCCYSNENLNSSG